MKTKMTWKEKLNNSHDLPKIVELEGKMAKKFGEGSMVIPAPIEVDAVMKQVKKGKLITINGIRDILAKKHNTDMACPITTGIFARIAAEAAAEALEDGKKRVTPFWRTLKKDGVINIKYPGGIQGQIELLESEGHTVVPKGKNNFRVVDYERKIIK